MYRCKSKGSVIYLHSTGLPTSFKSLHNNLFLCFSYFYRMTLYPVHLCAVTIKKELISSIDKINHDNQDTQDNYYMKCPENLREYISL